MEKLPCIWTMVCKNGQSDTVEQMVCISLKAQHVSGMTHFDLIVHIGKIHVWLLDVVE